ncbi:hypothetical protein LguiA_023724 [Lonicera macranthoides]
MVTTKRFNIFVLPLMIIIIVTSQYAQAVESKPTIQLQHQQRYSKMLSTLGMVCKCCDDECRSTWEGSCSNLQCLPWKKYY